jgi:hypothetical protein
MITISGRGSLHSHPTFPEMYYIIILPSKPRFYIMAFRDVTVCDLVITYQHQHPLNLKMEAVSSSETLVPNYQTIWRYITEDRIL